MGTPSRPPLWIIGLVAGGIASADVIHVPAHLLPNPLVLDELDVLIWFMQNGMPTLVDPVAMYGPVGDPPMLEVLFDPAVVPMLGCLSFYLDVGTFHCQRTWHHPGQPWPPCDNMLVAEFAPMEWCACILGDLAIHPAAAVTDLRLAGGPAGMRLDWSAPVHDEMGCTPLEIEGFEVHSSSESFFTPSPATLQAVVEEPWWETDVPAGSRRFFQVVVRGQRTLP